MNAKLPSKRKPSRRTHASRRIKQILNRFDRADGMLIHTKCALIIVMDELVKLREELEEYVRKSA